MLWIGALLILLIFQSNLPGSFLNFCMSEEAQADNHRVRLKSWHHEIFETEEWRTSSSNTTRSRKRSRGIFHKIRTKNNTLESLLAHLFSPSSKILRRISTPSLKSWALVSIKIPTKGIFTSKEYKSLAIKLSFPHL